MMVFSTLPVLQQFLASTLNTATEEGLVPGAGSVVMVCSASDDIQSDWCRKVEDQMKVERILQTNERVLFVTTYASAYKIDLALRATESSLDLAVFDEAHSVHTAKRCFLWGGGEGDEGDEGDEEEDDAGGATPRGIAKSKRVRMRKERMPDSKGKTTEVYLCVQRLAFWLWKSDIPAASISLPLRASACRETTR